MKKIIKDLDLDIVELDGVSNLLLHNFTSGDTAFDSYIKNNAIIDKDNGEGVTFIIVNHEEGHNPIPIAYYTISAFTVHIVDRYDYEDDDIPEEEKREHFSPIPSIMISRFAVDENYQDTFYNNDLVAALILRAIIDEICDMTKSVIGAKMISLCAVDTAVDFYEKNGFKKFPKDFTVFDFMEAQENTPMYLALHKINALEKIKKSAS